MKNATRAKSRAKSAGANGFTLIELVVAIAVATVIGAAATIAMSGSFAAWTRLSVRSTGDFEQLSAVSAFRRDFASSFPQAGAICKGDSSSCTFPALILSSHASVAEPALVTWSYDSASKTLTRAISALNLDGSADDYEAPLANEYRQIDSFAFKYANAREDYAPESPKEFAADGAAWQDEMAARADGGMTLPSAIRVAVNGAASTCFASYAHREATDGRPADGPEAQGGDMQ